MRRSYGYLFRAHDSKGVSHFIGILAEPQRQTRQWKSFLVGKRQGGFIVPLLEDVGIGKLEVGYLEVGQPLRLLEPEDFKQLWLFWLLLNKSGDIN